MKNGGTGIPGPILSFAKELSSLPFFKDMQKNDLTIPQWISKAFNGTLFAEHDENGKIIKDSIVQMDLRSELGVLVETGKQAIPVIANECIVRVFYFVRRFAKELKNKNVNCLKDFKNLEIEKVLPRKSPTLTRMLTIATSVFTTLDVSEAITSKKYWVTINYVGVARLVISLGNEIVWALKIRDVKNLRTMYERIERNTFTKADKRMFDGVFDSEDYEKFGLTLEETEILFNIEYYKTMHDIESTKLGPIKTKKSTWLKKWKGYINDGFPKFMNKKDAKFNWYSLGELNKKIQECNPNKTWFRLVLLEAMLFVPYFPLETKTKKNGTIIPNKDLTIDNPITGYNQKSGDKYLDDEFSKQYLFADYVTSRLRKCYNNCLNRLKSTLKDKSLSIAIALGKTLFGIIGFVLSSAYIKSHFPGLNGAAIISTFLAFSGGGVVATGGNDTTEEIKVIASGSLVLGIGGQTDASEIVGSISHIGKDTISLQSIKLVIAVKEIFLNDEKDIMYSKSIYDKYVRSIDIVKKSIKDLERQIDVANEDRKKELNRQINEAKKAVKAMNSTKEFMDECISSY